MPIITVPTGVAAFPKEVAQVPRRWVEQYFNLRRYQRLNRGGHFPAVENPSGLASEIRAFFTSVSS
jgi:pimeloyl-ACP methyl ester carboxylesterase